MKEKINQTTGRLEQAVRAAGVGIATLAASFWRRIGKKKPPVELGVDKKSYSKRKDLLW